MALFTGPTKGLLLVPRLLGNFCEAVLAGLRGFITGAGTGIGRAIALEMVREGADLYITDLDLEAAQRVANEARALRAEAHVWADQLDVRNVVNVTPRIQNAPNPLAGLTLPV